MSKLAIIGTAGRYADGAFLMTNPKYYFLNMIRAAHKVIEETNATTLISGGAAWADDIAIHLFLRDQVDDGFYESLKLELYLPTSFVQDNNQKVTGFQEGDKSKFDTGSVANHYHRRYYDCCKGFIPDWSPFDNFTKVINNVNCKLEYGKGFLNRNKMVAKEADHCLAMTFGNKRVVKDGGTAHTMSEFLKKPNHGQAWHLDLNTCKLYKDAEATYVLPAAKRQVAIENSLKGETPPF